MPGKGYCLIGGSCRSDREDIETLTRRSTTGRHLYVGAGAWYRSPRSKSRLNIEFHLRGKVLSTANGIKRPQALLLL